MSETNLQDQMTIEGIDVGKVKNFPFSALKTLGSIQMGIGGICICVGLVDFLMFIFFEDQFLSDPVVKDTDAYQKVDTLTKTFTPVWCGVWFCVTGAFAAMLTEKKLTNVNYYKMTFLILSMTCAAISGPLCFIVSVTSAYLRHEIKPEGFRWLVPLLVTFFAFCEIMFAIISSAVCCCCSPFDSSRVRVLLAKQQDNEFHAIVKQPAKEKRDTFDIFTTADKEGKPLPPRQEEIKQSSPKQRPITKDNRKQKTHKKEEIIQESKHLEDDNRHSHDRKSERKQSRDRKSEMKQSSNGREEMRRKNSDDFSEPPFDDDEQMPTRGNNDRPYTKGSSYEQLKNLVIPRTAPKQTF